MQERKDGVKAIDMTGKEKQILAQTLYLSGKHTQKAIAELTGVTEKTIGKWAVEGKWEEMRQAG